MNREYLLKLADFIEAKPEVAFDMGGWGGPNTAAPCGTTACIAGWGILMARPQFVSVGAAARSFSPKVRDDGFYTGPFAKLAGLSQDETALLCYKYWPTPYQERLDNGESEKTVAVALLRDVANGVVTL